MPAFFLGVRTALFLTWVAGFDLRRAEQFLVPGAGLEPAWQLPPPRDFKSLVSSCFTTRANRYSSRVRPRRGR